MIKQTPDNNSILLYHAKIETGEIIACQKIWKVYKHLAEKTKATDLEYYYNPDRGNHIIDFFEKYLRHSKGKFGGKPVTLELWEKAMLNAQFGFVDIEENRQYNRCVLIVGKKNGKSLISSGEGLYLLVADNEAGPEVYSTATKRDQAKIIWDESKRMRNKSPVLKKRIKATVNELKCDANDGVFKALASDSNTLDGLNVHGALMDEIHQWRNGKALYDIIADGVSAREQPMVFITSTAGTVREDIYDEIYDECEMIINGYDQADGYKDERTLPLLYELDDRKEYTDEKTWIKANPNLGVSKSYSYLKDKVDKAKQNPTVRKGVLCKEFNIRETSSEAFLSFEVLNNTATYDLKELKPRYGIVGIDLGSTTDLTCATVIFRIPNDEILYVKQMYWLPSDLLEKRVEEDKIPYNTWIDKGLMRVSEGNKVNYKDVTEWLLEMQNEHDIFIYKIGYDAWSSTYLVDELKMNFGKDSTVPVIQGPKTFSSPLRRVAAELESKKINYDNNSIFKWCASNAAVKTDSNDNIALVKTSNQRRRIDGFASFMDAYIVYENNHEDYLNLI